MKKHIHIPIIGDLYLVLSKTDPYTVRTVEVEREEPPTPLDEGQMEKNLDRIILMIGNCDQKASYLLAMVGVAATVFLVSDVVARIKQILIEPFYLYWNDGIGSFCFIRFLLAILLIGGLICILLSLFFLLKCLTSRTDYDKYKEPGMTEKSLLFFKHIAGMNYGEFCMTRTNRFNDLRSQTYINSKICTAKFDYYSIGLKYFIVAILLLSITFVIFLFV